jgi:hypothetical protein
MSRTAINFEYIRVPEIAFNGACAVSFWAKAPTNSNTACMVFGQYGRFQIERLVTGDWRWTRAYTGSLSIARWRWSAAAVAGAGVNTANWNHYLFQHVGGGDAPILFVNGVAVPFTVDIAPEGTLAQNVNAPVYLLNEDGRTRPFDGDTVTGGMHAAAFYTTTLSLAQVQRIVSDQRYPLPGLIAFYPLDTAPARDAHTGARGAIAGGDTSRAGTGDPAVPLRYWEVPTSLTPQRENTSLVLTWADIPGAVGYTVEYRAVGATPWSSVQTSAAQAMLSGLAPSTTYEIRISTRSAVQVSAPSAVFTVATRAAGDIGFVVPPAFDLQPLHLTLREYAGGPLRYDFSADLTDLAIEDDVHGCAAISGAVEMDLDDAVPLTDSGEGMHLQASIAGERIASGRLEQPGFSDGPQGTKLTFTAFGYQQAFDDIPYSNRVDGMQTNTLANSLFALARNINPTQLAPVWIGFEFTGVFMPPNTEYDKKSMRVILDELAALGDAQTPPRRWQWTVDAYQVFRFAPEGTGSRTWYLQAGQYTAKKALKDQYNRVSVSYKLPGFSPPPSTESVWSMRSVRLQREKGISSSATTLTEANRIRDLALRDVDDPLPQVTIVAKRFTNRRGVPVPIYEPRANDVITVVDLAPTLSIRIDRFRTFRVIHRRYRPLVDLTELTLAAPPAQLDWLLARQKAGL